MATAAEIATLKTALRSSFPYEQSWVFTRDRPGVGSAGSSGGNLWREVEPRAEIQCPAECTFTSRGKLLLLAPICSVVALTVSKCTRKNWFWLHEALTFKKVIVVVTGHAARAVHPQTPWSMWRGKGGFAASSKSSSLEQMLQEEGSVRQIRRNEMRSFLGRNTASCTFLHGFQGSLCS